MRQLRSLSLALTAAAALVLAACSDDGTPDAGVADSGVHPDATEIPDCRDQNCDGTTDEGVTLAQIDDAYEPDDTAERPFDLRTSRDKSFTRELVLVTRDVGDDEWFEEWEADTHAHLARTACRTVPLGDDAVPRGRGRRVVEVREKYFQRRRRRQLATA